MADQNFRVKRGLEVGVGGTIITAKSTGNVGISSAEPTVKLDVGGDVKATTFVGALTGTATTASNLNRSVTAGSGLTGGGTLTSDVTLNVGAGSGISINADDVQLKNAGSLTNNYLSKWDSGNTQLTNSIITDDGTNIGINSTSPAFRLDVVGDIKVSGISTLGDNVYLPQGKSVFFGSSKFDILQNSSTQSVIRTQSGSNLFLAAGGYIDLADTNALNRSARFTPGGAADLYYAGVRKLSTTTTGVSLNSGQYQINDISVLSATTLGSGVTNSSLTGLGTLTQLSVSGVSTFNSNVGIATTNPSSRLHVVGDGRFTGVVTATTFIGNLTGTATTATTVSSDSDSNTKVGTGAGSSLVASSGTNNTFFGFSAGCRVTTGDYNIALGSLALLGSASGVTGSHNVAIGRCAGADLNSGACNNFLGYFAGHQLVSGSDNNFFGSAAGYANTSGNSNNFLGYYAGRSNTTGCYNNFFGSNSGFANTTSSNSIAIGREAGYWNRGNNNIYLGECAGKSATRAACTTGSHNVAIGQSAGANITFGSRNNFLGNNAGFSNDFGSSNNFFGACAGYSNTSGEKNNFFGTCAGSSNTTGSDNNFFGFYAGRCNETGSYNNFLGTIAGVVNTTGNCNNFFGYAAGRCNTTGCDNNFFGSNAGYCNITQSNSIAIGREAGYWNRGNNNIYLGECAGRSATRAACTTGIHNVAIGQSAGANVTTGSDNNFLGASAGECNTSGSGNIFLGRFSGCTNTTGSCNIAIGYSAQLPIITGSNQLVIGAGSTAWIYGNNSYNVGLGTTNPTTKLHVIGDVTAITFFGALTGTATTASDLNRSVTAGAGLTGGGTLTADITLNVGAGDGISVAADSVAVDTTVVRTTRTITSGNGLTGGGDLSSDRTLAVGAGSGISVNADDVQLKNAGSLTNNYLSKWDSGNTQLTNSSVIDTGINIGIGTTNPLSKLQVERYGVSTGFGTFSATAGIATDIDTFTISSTDFKTVEYTLHFSNGSNIQSQKVLVMQNGTTAYSQEYAIMFEPNQIVSIGATVSSGICKLRATPESGISGLTTYRIIRQTVL